MKKFIEELTNYIKENDYNLSNLTIVIPSRRAKKYIQKSLFETYNKPIFSPEIITIDQWVRNHTEEIIIDKTRAVFKLYKIHKQLAGEENKGLDEFLKWGRTLLNDFDEIDRYELTSEQLFRNLRDVRELEAWNIDEDNMTDRQKRFLAFWESLPNYYKAYKKILAEEQAINMGAAYQKLSKNINLLFEKKKEKQFIFAGFNALSKAEMSIIKQLIKIGRAKYFIDADTFYFKDKNHEAGMFLREVCEAFDITQPSFVKNNIATQTKKVEVINCTQSTGQAKTVATILLDEIPVNELSDTVLLLANEEMVVPVLKNIPNKIKEANITLGLPLKNTALKSWCDLLFNMQENYLRFTTKSLYYKDFLKLIKHPFLLAIFSEEDKNELVKLEQFIANKNWLFLNLDKLDLSANAKEILSLTASVWNQTEKNYPIKATAIVRELNSKLFKLIQGEEHALEKAILYNFDASLVKLTNILDEFKPQLTFNTFKSIFNEHWASESLAYYGNPLDGLQIMGLLETRLLDFKNVVVIGLNEGSMPPNNPIQTLIPMDLRRFHGLPTPREKQGLFAHHIYRMFHHAENVWITYSSAAHSMGVDEPSRYLHQIKLEMARSNPNIEYIEKDYTIKDSEQSSEKISIPKTDAILERLDDYFSHRTSASALNKFLACPLDFYYRYILGFGEEKEVEEDIEANNFGSFIHNTLEKLFEPFARFDKALQPTKAKTNVTAFDIDKMMKEFPTLLQTEFIKHFDNKKEHLTTGKNYLSLQVAEFLMQKILKHQKQKLEENPDAKLFIDCVEGEFSKEIIVEIDKHQKLIRFTGFIDRIDNFNEQTRILDYKSGKCDESKVKISKKRNATSDLEALKINLKDNHFVFQLLIYNMLYKEAFPNASYPENTGITSMVNIEDSPYFLTNKLTEDTESLMELFEETIHSIIRDIYDLEQPFEHNPDSKFCQYCI